MDRRAPLGSWFRRLVHGMVIVFGWALFFAFWIKLLLREAFNVRDAVLLIVVALCVVPLITFFWVAHNKRIYDRKGPRRSGFSPPETYERDWPGRTVFAARDQLKLARYVMILPGDYAKVFKAYKRTPRTQ